MLPNVLPVYISNITSNKLTKVKQYFIEFLKNVLSIIGAINCGLIHFKDKNNCKEPTVLPCCETRLEKKTVSFQILILYIFLDEASSSSSVPGEGLVTIQLTT